MNKYSITSFVDNSSYAKQLGLPPFYYRSRSCNTNLTGSTPADQYQRLKLIQNTIRIHSSLYTANLGSLTAYKKPISDPNKKLYGVCWNQMSDRPVPSVQKATIPTGFASSMNRKHTSVTSSRPGCQTPGGVGCDIKHNSYDRYLNRLKGKGPLRRGIVPANFGKPIPFNPAFPVYGGKTIKTNIVNGCSCDSKPNQNILIYNNPLWQPYPSAIYGFSVGSNVYAIKTGTDYYSKALVIEVNNGVYTIEFEDGTIQIVDNVSELLIYYPCNCPPISKKLSFKSALYTVAGSNMYGIDCEIPSTDFLSKLVN
jgi:hypothetical protein